MDDPDRKLLTVASPDDSIDREAGDGMFSSEGGHHAGAQSRKIGVAGAVFLILNKMIGTGSRTPPDGHGPG
jgi:hypothetical protein